MKNNKTSEHRVRNPRITLYAFHIREELGNEVAEDAHQLWEKISSLSKAFSIPELENFTEKLICYENGNYHPEIENNKETECLDLIQPKQRLDFKKISQENDLILSGSVYPLRLHDTYAVDLTLSYANQEIELSDLSCLNPNGSLLPSHIQASLGQTLVLCVEPEENITVDQTLADECVRALLQNSSQSAPPLINSGKLFGSPVFEYESESCHLMVWVNIHPQTSELKNRAYYHLMNLFCYRSKISFTYKESRRCYEESRRLYGKLESKGNIIRELNTRQNNYQQNFFKLKEILSDIPLASLEYACYLRDMEDFRTMIKNNARNYAISLTEIADLSQPEHQDELTFLEDFQTTRCRQFQDQIQVDLSYLAPGQNLFQQIINTIRGLVEIDTLTQLKDNENAGVYILRQLKENKNVNSDILTQLKANKDVETDILNQLKANKDSEVDILNQLKANGNTIINQFQANKEKKFKQHSRMEILITFIATTLAFAIISATVKAELIPGLCFIDQILLHLVIGLLFGGAGTLILVIIRRWWHD